ncbi:lipopolysaccharide biosynthesis protein [Microbacterium sp. NPDC091313]
MKVLLARLVAFGTAPMIAAVVPLLVLPVASRVEGVAGWAAIGTGQALGSLCAMIASFGWNVSGGAQIALAPDDMTRRDVYAHSFWSRGAVFLLVGGATAGVAATLVGGQFAGVAALSAIATGLTGMGMSWYAVGTGRANLVLWYEAIPVAAFTALSAALMLFTGMLILYPLLMIVGSLVGLAALHRHLFRSLLPPFHPARIRASFRRNAVIAGADGIGGSYTTAPIPIAQALVGTAAAAQLTSADKLYRIGLTAILVVGNTLQKWVLEATWEHGRARRHIVAFALHAAVGVVGLLVLVLLGPTLTTWLLGAEVSPPASMFPAYGVTYFIISLTTPFIRNVLVPAGRSRIVFTAIVASACVGLPLMLVLGASLGATAIVWGLAASEIVVLAVVGVAGIREIRRAHSAAVETPA